MVMIDFGLEELSVHEDFCNILCDFDKFGMMQDQLSQLSVEVKSAEIERIPTDTKKLKYDDALKILNIIEKFEENDDVQKVFHNLNINDEIISQLNN